MTRPLYEGTPMTTVATFVRIVDVKNYADVSGAQRQAFVVEPVDP